MNIAIVSNIRCHYSMRDEDDVRLLIIRNILDFAKSQGLPPPDEEEITIIGQGSILSLACMTVRTSCEEIKKGMRVVITALAIPQGINYRYSGQICMTGIATCIA